MSRIIRAPLNRLLPGGIILGYHRISDTTWDPLNIAVSGKYFRSQLQVLSELYEPVSLKSLVEMKRKGMSLKGFVSITFDDGCEDFIRQAVPELTRRSIPATVFVTTGYSGKQFWWDEISCLMSKISADVDQIEVDLGPPDGRRIFRNLSLREPAANAVREICNQLLYLEPSARAEIIDRIRQQTAGDLALADVPRSMTRKQLQELSETQIVEIAAHTVTHPMLSQLDEAEQLDEIQRSKSDLETFGTAVTVAAVELVLIALVWRASILSSHRIAGPVYVFARQIIAVGAGDLTALINFRDKDRF